jgi:hypothetical protein
MDRRIRIGDAHELPPSYADFVALYGDVRSGIEHTDGVSFKLIGIVPVVSGGGAGVLTWLLEHQSLAPLAIAALALLAGVSTYGVYRWELRNIQTCNRLWARAALLEEQLGFGELSGREAAPSLRGIEIGKTEAERLIYGAALMVWLVPVFVAVM